LAAGGDPKRRYQTPALSLPTATDVRSGLM
jgi:hypothetical protein